MNRKQKRLVDGTVLYFAPSLLGKLSDRLDDQDPWWFYQSAAIGPRPERLVFCRDILSQRQQKDLTGLGPNPLAKGNIRVEAPSRAPLGG